MSSIDVDLVQSIIDSFVSKYNIPVKRNSKSVIEQILFETMVEESYDFDSVNQLSLYTNISNEGIIRIFTEIRAEYLNKTKPKRIAGIKFEIEDAEFNAVKKYLNSKQKTFDTIGNFDELLSLILTFANSGGDPRKYYDRVIQLTGLDIEKASDLLSNSSRVYLAAFNKRRMISTGSKGFVWSDSGDTRVCHDCRKRHGKLFLFSDPELVFPGEREGCRCVAESVDDDDIEKMKNNKKYTYYP